LRADPRYIDMAKGDRWTIYQSPLGELTVIASQTGALKVLRFPRGPRLDETGKGSMAAVIAQLEEYFSGKRQSFDLPLEISGTPLQLRVWERLREIPYGSTVSYGELADSLEEAAFPPALEPHERVRAVAGAVGRTPVPIVVPCHRVIGADGSLTGYGGGLWRKRILLELESSQLALL
jgi:methylated-DNA-[protein]-cysteine S-methyltransferase